MADFKDGIEAAARIMDYAAARWKVIADGERAGGLVKLQAENLAFCFAAYAATIRSLPPPSDSNVKATDA